MAVEGIRISRSLVGTITACAAVLATGWLAHDQVVVPVQAIQKDIAVMANNFAIISRIVDRLQIEVVSLSKDNARMQVEIENIKARERAK